MSKAIKQTSWAISSEVKSLFCPQCNSILALPDAGNVEKCYECQYAINSSHIEENFQCQVKNYNTRKEIVDIFSDPTARRAIIQQDCPNCDHPELRFYTLQKRSVDEGQTVFYECEACGHSYSVDN